MALSTEDELNTQVGTLYPDNTSGDITPDDLRTQQLAAIESMYNLTGLKMWDHIEIDDNALLDNEHINYGIKNAQAAPISLTIDSGNVIGLAGRTWLIKDEAGNAGTFPITIVPIDPCLIDGQSTAVIDFDYGFIKLTSDGSNLYTSHFTEIENLDSRVTAIEISPTTYVHTESDFDDGTDDPGFWTVQPGDYRIRQTIILTRPLRLQGADSTFAFFGSGPLFPIAIAAPMGAVFDGRTAGTVALMVCQDLLIVDPAGLSTQLFDILAGPSRLGVTLAFTFFQDFSNLGTFDGLGMQSVVGVFDNINVQRTAPLTLTNNAELRLIDTLFRQTLAPASPLRVIENLNPGPITGIEVNNTGLQTLGSPTFFIDPDFLNNPNALTSIVAGNNISGVLFEVGTGVGTITSITDGGGGELTITIASGTDPAASDSLWILGTDDYDGGYIVSSINAGVSFNVTGTFVGAETPSFAEYSNGSADQRAPNILVESVVNARNSMNVADAALTTPETVTITVQSQIESINGVNWESSENTERFFVNDAGVCEYRGGQESTVTIHGTATIEKDGGGTDVIALYVMVNGTADLRSEAQTENNTPTAVASISAATLVDGDTIELGVANTTSTTDIIVSVARLLAIRSG